jgi:hypothetical protein
MTSAKRTFCSSKELEHPARKMLVNTIRKPDKRDLITF